MKQSFGIGLVLLGALMFHIASHNENPLNIREVWKDILSTMNHSSGSASGPGTPTVPAVDTTSGGTNTDLGAAPSTGGTVSA